MCKPGKSGLDMAYAYVYSCIPAKSGLAATTSSSAPRVGRVATMCFGFFPHSVSFSINSLRTPQSKARATVRVVC